MRIPVLFAALIAAPPVAASTLIVGNKEADTVSLIDLETGRERAVVDTGANPHEVAVSPDGRLAAVVAYGSNTIDIIDIAAAAHVRRCDLGEHDRPHGIYWAESGRILATTEGNESIVSIRPDCSRLIAARTDQRGSHMLAVDEEAGKAFISNLGDRTVTAVDLRTARKLADFDAAEEPEGIALTPDGSELWVANRGSASVFVLDPETGERLASIDVGRVPIRLAISPDGKWAVTSDYRDGALSVIDVEARRKVRTIDISGDEDARQVTVVWSDDGARLYVAETGRARIAEVDFASGRVLRRLEAGRGSDGLGWSPVSAARN